MDQAALVQAMIPALSVMLVITLLSVIAAVVLGVLVWTRSRTPALLSGLALGLLPLGIAVLALIPVKGPPTFSQAWAFGPAILGIFAVLLPALLHLAGTAAAGASRGPRTLWVPAVATAGVVVVAALPSVAASMVGEGQFTALGGFRTVVYGLAGLLLLPALLAGDPDEAAGPEASAAAGLSYVTVVGLGEAAVRSIFGFVLLGAFAATRTPDKRMELVDTVIADLLAPLTPWSWATFAVAAVVAALAVVPALRTGGSRAALSGLGLVWVGIAALPLLLAGPDRDTWRGWSTAVPLPEASPVEAPVPPLEPPGSGAPPSGP